jgi:hypothetical protein
MQKTMFIKPDRNERTNPPQRRKYIETEGIRGGSKRETLPPIVPIVDRRHWYSVAQVRAAIARNQLSVQFRNRALALAESYEKCFGGTVLVTPVNGALGLHKKDHYESQVTVVAGKVLASKLTGKTVRTITLPNPHVVRPYEGKPKFIGHNPYNGELLENTFQRGKKQHVNELTPSAFGKFVHSPQPGVRQVPRKYRNPRKP